MTTRMAFQDPIYRANFRVFVGAFDAVSRYMSARGFDPYQVGPPRGAKTIEITSDGCHEILLWFPATWDPRTPRGCALLAHEAIHAAEMALASRGLRRDEFVNEALNYYAEYLVHTIATRYAGRRRSKAR